MSGEELRELASIARAARRLLERERAAGTGELLASSAGVALRARGASNAPTAIALESETNMFEEMTSSAPSSTTPITFHPRDPALRAQIAAAAKPVLEAVAAEVRVCEKCALHKGRTNGVPGVGAALSGIVFVGEGPGADEDRLGEPFVGRSGQLLDKILVAMNEAKLIPGVTLDRTTVFIGNIVHCRPPENRAPLPEEVEQSLPYLMRQLDALKPRVICCLGKTAAEGLLGIKSALGPLRGRVHPFRGSKLIVTYHPAACLRNPGYKRPVWEDMQLLAREYLKD